jgi:hypothetical protein
VKTIDTVQMSDHLDQQVTGLVTCWIIEREDGQVYRFTDATEDITVDGDLYSSVGAYKRSAIETTSTLSVDNLDVVGIAGDLSLPAQDLRNGLFDNARISIFMAAWSALVPGKVRLRRGFFGEVQSLPNGTFQVELRGLMQRLSYNYLDMFSATCLYDLGEPACGIVIRPDQVQRSTSYAVGDTVLAAQSSAESLGLRYDLAIDDASFETLGANGFSASLSWYDAGANPMTTTTAQSVSGSTSLIGGAGAGATRQVIEVETATEMPMSVVEAGQASVRFNGYWRDDGDQTRYTVRFLDENYTQINESQSVRSTARQRYTSTFSIAGDFTVAFWINPDNNDVGGIMAGGTEAGADLGSAIRYQNEQIVVRGTPLNVGTDVIFTDPSNPKANVTIGQWNHIAITRTGTTNRIYVNFELVATTGTVWGPFFFEDLFAENDELSSLIIGDNFALDDVRIYDVAKSHSDIIAEAQNPPVLPDANLLRWFPFDDGTLNDATGNDATNYGAGAGTTYAVSAAPIDGNGPLTGYDSGNVSPGSTWTFFQSPAIFVPSRTKLIELTLITTGSSVNFDALSSYMYDAGALDPVFLPSDVTDVYWECTSGGTTAASYPATFTGGAGSTAVDGSVTWTARNAYLRAGRVISADNQRTFTSSVNEPRAVDAWFNGGSVIFVTGDNAGVVMEVKDWLNADGQIELFLSVPGEIASGDEFFIYPGCDKSRISCAAIFDNIINFFGFPDVPGQDDFLRYPDAKD